MLEILSITTVYETLPTEAVVSMQFLIYRASLCDVEMVL